LQFTLENRRGCKARVDGREMTLFSSNDYLGLSAHAAVIAAASEAASNFGAGTGGAPGTTGTTRIHEQLQEKIAAFKSRQRAVLFPSGYQANQALHHALDSERTVFIIDKRHHPSALDGVGLAKNSKVLRFEHSRLDELTHILSEHLESTCVISLPSVFTVDGDIAPLDKLMSIKRNYGVVLILDEAHATGCLGKTGRGLEEHYNLKGSADFIMGTFSKALGSQGGFLAFDTAAEKYVHAPFRAHEYSTSLSAVSAAAALKAIEILESNPALLEALHDSKNSILEECRNFGINLIARESMVMLLPCKNSVRLQELLFESGFLVIPVSARIDNRIRDCLRIVPMATHSQDDIKLFAAALAKYKDLLD